MLDNPGQIEIETVGAGLEEARAKLQATRAALLPVARDSAEVRDVLARLDRMAAELGRIEEEVAGRVAIGVK